jgi:hypothetical protein
MGNKMCCEKTTTDTQENFDLDMDKAALVI